MKHVGAPRAALSRAGAQLIVLLGLLGGGLVACSSPPPQTATLVESSATVLPGESVTLSGALSVHKAGLAVALESGSGTSFAPTGTSAATDGSGSFTLRFTPKSAGTMRLRVHIINGKATVVSPTIILTSLATTGVSAALDGRAEVAVNARATISGRVIPGVVGRPVMLQSSPDGSTWTAISIAGKTNAAGVFHLRAPTKTQGPVILRVIAAATSTHAEGVSVAVHLYIADYKAAGVRYLSCVKGANARGVTLDAARTKFDSGQIAFADLRAKDAAYASALRAQIVCLNGYAWPPSIADLAKDLASQDAVSADAETGVARAKNLDDYITAQDAPENITASTAAGADAAKIRRALGLPARSS
jgi:hypothetical protein